jgi:hypothetical protein
LKQARISASAHGLFKSRNDRPIDWQDPARTGHSFAPDAPFGMTGSEVEPTMFVGQTEPTRSLRIADIRGFECSSAGSLRERQLLMGLS